MGTSNDHRWARLMSGYCAASEAGAHVHVERVSAGAEGLPRTLSMSPTSSRIS